MVSTCWLQFTKWGMPPWCPWCPWWQKPPSLFCSMRLIVKKTSSRPLSPCHRDRKRQNSNASIPLTWKKYVVLFGQHFQQEERRDSRRMDGEEKEMGKRKNKRVAGGLLQGWAALWVLSQCPCFSPYTQLLLLLTGSSRDLGSLLGLLPPFPCHCVELYFHLSSHFPCIRGFNEDRSHLLTLVFITLFMSSQSSLGFLSPPLSARF